MATKKPDSLPIMKFRVVSTGCEIELVRIKKTMNGERLARPIYEFAYTNRPDKPNFTTYSENILESVHTRATWQTLT